MRVTKKGQLLKERDRSLTPSSFYERYGKPFWQYFYLSYFTVFLNFLTTLIGLCNWFLFSTCKQQASYFNHTWLICSILLMCLYFFSGPLFSFSCLLYDRTFNEDVAKDAIPEREMIAKGISLWISCLLSLSFFIVTSGLLCGMVWAQRVVSYSPESNLPFGVTPFFLMGLLVSVCFSVINIVWSFLSFKITQHERWLSWEHFQRSHGVKIIVMKIVLSSFMYLFLSLIITPTPGDGTCVANTVGNAYLIVIGTELLVSLFVKTLLPTAIFCKTKKRTLEFDVAEEMLQIFYRQYIVQLCSFVSPWAGIVSLVSSLLEICIDSLRFKYVCDNSMQMVGDLRWTISLLFLFLAFCSFISYPNGFLWMVILPETLPFSYRSC